MNETTPPLVQSENTHPILPPMHQHHFMQKKVVFFLLFFIIGLVAGSYFTRLATKSPETISVVGTSSQTVHADKATLTATTYETGATAAQAKANDDKVIADITKRVQQLGLKESDVKIVSTRNTDYYNAGGPSEAPVPTVSCLGNCPGGGGGGGGGGISPADANATYNASTDIKIEFDKSNIDRANAVSDMMTGLNVYPTLFYNLANKDNILVQNKQQAIENAKIQADSLAKSNGEIIKKVIGIKENIPTPDQSNASQYADPTVDSPTQDIQVTSSFEVTYQISTSLFSL